MSDRAHLEQVAKMKGELPPELEVPDFPDIASHIWVTFNELSAGRTYGMSGPNPLSWEGIKAWVDLNGIVLTPWELETIKALDMAWVRSVNEDNG